MQKALCLSEPAHAVEVATSTLTETASSNPSVSTTRWRLRLLTFLHASTSVALLHKAASRRHDPDPRRTHATAATGTVCARPI